MSCDLTETRIHALLMRSVWIDIASTAYTSSYRVQRAPKLTCSRQLCSRASAANAALLLTLIFLLPQEIAEIKMPDLNATTIEAAMRIVEGTARNMGIKVQVPEPAA